MKGIFHSGVVFLGIAWLGLAGCSKESERLPRPPDTEAVTNAIAVITSVFAADGDFKRIDVKDMKVGELRRELSGVSPRATLWMPGEHDWLVVGAQRGTSNSLERVMDVFAAQDLRISLPEIFCAYVGTLAEVCPAFETLESRALVTPQYFVTREIPKVAWLTNGDVDADIRDATLSEIRSMQLVRREVLRGNMIAAAAKDRKGEKSAIEMWSKAALRNPNDTMLVERIERLNRNAQGFLQLGKVLQAMKCYETVMLIRPTATSVHNFGMCLKKIGKLDLANKVLAQARELEKAEGLEK